MKNDVVVSYEAQLKVNRELRTKYDSPLIKWYDTNMTKTEKYKFGLMTYDEFVAWQQELHEKMLNGELDTDDSSTDTSDTGSTNHTFWEDDDGDRENISADDYAAFLAANNIDVSNKNAIDFN